MYLLTENFKNGMDSRRMALTSKPGTLQELINGHITRGGEIEKRKAFVPFRSLPVNTFGLHSCNGQLWVFGSESVNLGSGSELGPSEDPNVFLPTVNYMKLTPGLNGAQKSAQFTFSGDVLKQSDCVVSVGGYKSTVSMVGHGFSTGGVYTLSFSYTGATTVIACRVTVIGADSFTAETGAFQIPSGATATYTYTYQLWHPGSVRASGYYTTETASKTGSTSAVAVSSSTCNIAFPGATSLPSVVYLYFPQYPSISGNYAVNPGTPDATGFVVGGTFGLGVNPTKVIVNPGITAVTVGFVNLLSAAVPWSFSASATSDQQDDMCAAVAASINAGTGTHGYAAVVVAGTVLLYGNPASSASFSITSTSLYVNILRPFTLTGSVMTKLLHAENYGGKIYAIAEFDGDKIHHFYDGKRVVSWDSISRSGDIPSVSSALAEEIHKDGIYNSTSNGAVITIQFTQNAKAFAVSASSSETGMTVSVSTTDAGSSYPQVTQVTLGGAYSSSAIIQVNVAGDVYSVQAGSASVGTFARTYNNKMYSIANSLLYFSETDTNGGPSAFSNDTNKGAGVINLSNQDSGSESLTSIAIYQGKLAIFSRTAVQIWTMNADPKQNSQSQILNNIGTFAPKSVVAQGNIDTYFLSSSGVRSLKARDASNAAIVSDVGTAIDDLVLADLRELDEDQKAKAIGLIDPLEGRYWLCVGARIYVYSYFPTPEIMAWSVYEPTSSTSGAKLAFSDITAMKGRIYCRAGNALYAYGGLNAGTYDASECVVTMPYLDGGKPAHFKTMTGIDCACVGTWDVYNGLDITVPDARDFVGTIENSTYSYGRLMATGIGTHIGVQMRHKTAEYSKIGNFAAHFEINEAG